MTRNEGTSPKQENSIIRRSLWALGFIVAAGIGIAGFSIATSLLVA